MQYEDALRLGLELKGLLAPASARIEVAGSVRRHKAEPKDIEIVCQPSRYDTYKERPGDLPIPYINSVDQAMHELVEAGTIQLGDPFEQNKDGKVIVCKAPFSEKYYRVKYKGEKVDVFVCTPPASWGVEFLLRTGDGGHNIWIVTKGYPRGIYFRQGRLVRHMDSRGRYIPDAQIAKPHGCVPGKCHLEVIKTPEEIDVFRALNLDYIKPEDRVKWQAATPKEWEEALVLG